MNEKNKIIKKIKNIKIPIEFKPSFKDYIDDVVPLKRTYSKYIIIDCSINNFKKNSKIRIFMESISRKYRLKENNLKLKLINNKEWYDNFDVEFIN